MKVIKEHTIWPNYPGMVVKRVDSNGNSYEAIMHKEEYELECFLNLIEKKGITSLDQVDELRKLIEEFGSLKHSLGYDAGNHEGYN
jgi:hypothetical protein